MSDRLFFDTNIFIYSKDPRDPLKQRLAIELLRDAADEGNGVISYQVIHEFFNFALQKSPQKMSPQDAYIFLADVFGSFEAVASSTPVVSGAIHIQQRYQLSWYDSLIVSAAQQGGCTTLYSEDLQHAQTFGTVTVRDPFR
ncbi:MAG: PIN domain-containing protein [Acidobacteriota bacterium]|nr:PIN domain-containing protein [Acidobacteriota bacterium]